MLSERIQIANTREHISWTYRFALFWFALSLAIFGGAYALAEIGEMSEASRTLMFVMLGTILVINAVWQAVVPGAGAGIAFNDLFTGLGGAWVIRSPHRLGPQGHSLHQST